MSSRAPKPPPDLSCSPALPPAEGNDDPDFDHSAAAVPVPPDSSEVTTVPPPPIRAAPAFSWAQRARERQTVPAKAVPLATVFATSTESEERDAALRNAAHKSVRHDLPVALKGTVALDANAFIKGLDDLLSVADVFVTIPQVIEEVKDRASRELLERLPFRLHVLDPSPASIDRVVKMAERTGDLGALSRTDVRLCAIALECAEQCGSIKVELTPCGPRINPQVAAAAAAASPPADAVPRPPAAKASDVQIIAEEQDEEDEEDDTSSGTTDSWEDDGEGEWIKPSTIASVRNRDQGPAFAGGGFVCVTSDFPMQNTLLHLGVPITGPQGRMIRELRTWLLRCHACYAVVHDTAKQFCPDCGSGDTLKRVSYVIDENGDKRLFINFKKKISTRGTIFNLPKPRGGRKGTNKTLALREDQLAKCGKAASQLKQHAIAREDDLAQFGVTDMKPHRFDPNMPRVFSSYKTFNVNERKKARAAKKK